jgi:hypothetical protein
MSSLKLMYIKLCSSISTNDLLGKVDELVVLRTSCLWSCSLMYQHNGNKSHPRLICVLSSVIISSQTVKSKIIITIIRMLFHISLWVKPDTSFSWENTDKGCFKNKVPRVTWDHNVRGGCRTLPDGQACYSRSLTRAIKSLRMRCSENGAWGK